MKQIRSYLLVMLMAVTIPSLFLSSCKKDDDDTESKDVFGTLKTYMEDNNLGLVAMMDDWIVGDHQSVYDAQTDADATNDYYIIDLRSADDYAAGHIAGAVNSTLADVLTTAENAAGKPILVVCYTGQTAGHANMALRLKGYSSQVLKWGMSGWNSAFDKWTSGTGDADKTNWESEPNLSTVAEFDYPTIEMDETDGAAILDARIEALLAGGVNKITNTEVLANPSNYFINNYWAAADVATYGHIKGAYRINPLDIDNLNNLDPSKTIVTYCWTGQTSSMVTAWLYVLGYDVKSLLFGANGMIYSDLQAHQWTGAAADLAYE